MIVPHPRSSCPINHSLELLGDRWGLLILRDTALHDRRSFRELLTQSPEGISAPVLSRRLADLVDQGLLAKAETTRGKQGRYSLTERGLATIPLLVELAHLGERLDPSTRGHAPDIAEDPDAIAAAMALLRESHIGSRTGALTQPE